jgi:hypothetical protein
MENIHHSVSSTTNLQFKLEQTTLQSEEIVVTASVASSKKDQIRSVWNVSADQIAQLPIENTDWGIDNLNSQISTFIQTRCNPRLKYYRELSYSVNREPH